MLLNDYPEVPADSLGMAQLLLEASCRPRRAKLGPVEAVESLLKHVCVCAQLEAEIVRDVLSDMRQRAAEMGTTGAALGITYARFLQLMHRSRQLPPPTPTGYDVVDAEEETQPDGGGVMRTHLVVAAQCVAVERVFHAFRKYLGNIKPHTRLDVVDETGALVSEPCHIDHVPILIAPMMCREWEKELLLALLKALKSQNIAGELARARRTGMELYLRAKLVVSNVGALVITNFTSDHVTTNLPAFWRVLQHIAQDGTVIVLCATAAIRSAESRLFRAVFPRPAREVVAYHPDNYANITKTIWNLFNRTEPMPSALRNVAPDTFGLRALMTEAWVHFNRLVNDQHVDIEAAATDLVERACTGRFAVVRELYRKLMDNEAIDPHVYKEYIDDLPSPEDEDEDEEKDEGAA
ncbi:hypothetical protein [Cupriavidus basilensis]